MSRTSPLTHYYFFVWCGGGGLIDVVLISLVGGFLEGLENIGKLYSYYFLSIFVDALDIRVIVVEQLHCLYSSA